MSQASTSSGNIELSASLLVTSTSSKYNKIWRKSLYIGFLISLKKPTTATSYEESQTLPSVPYRTSSSESSVAIDICSSYAQEEEEGEESSQQHIRSYLAGIVKEKDLESLREFGGVDRVSHVLRGQRQHSDLQKSSIDDNGNIGVLDTHNHTPLLPVHGTSCYFSGFLWNSCKNNRYTISMLLISAAFSFATEFLQEGLRYGWHDGVVMVFSALLLVAFSSITNFRRERKMMKVGQVKFSVQRGEDSPLVDLVIPDIVVGDLVYLRPRDEVPLDGLLVSHDTILAVTEGIRKEKINREGNPFLIAGSKVIAGHGWMLVVASVRNKSNSAEMKKNIGLLESLIEKPIYYIDKAALFIFTLVSLVVWIRVICKKDGDSVGLPEIKGSVSVGMLMHILERILLKTLGRISSLTGLLTFLILCVQHGVPLMVSISLKWQIDKVVAPDQGVVFNDLSACTTMGLVTVICIDVSGQLISKPMEVSRIWIGEGERDINKVEEEGSEDDDVLYKLKQGVGLSVLAPQLSLSPPMSNSLVSWAETTWQMDIESFTKKFVILKHSKLNSDKEGNGVLVTEVGGSEQVLHLHYSGDASTILEMCSQYYDSEGQLHAMENQKIKFGQVIKEMEENGLETIAFAYRQTNVQELEPDGLTFLALMGLKYKCQESTKSALKNLQNVGIQIKLVSEDDIMLVKDVIAHDLGIYVPENGGCLEGEQLKDLNDDKARLVKVDQSIVMGRFTPEDKLLMVQCLQKKGHVVAFTEHRLMTNYHTSQVLKVADVGIVHNCLSRIMKRESCGISITCFSALKPIVRAGRSKYHNIQKFIQLQMTVSISGLLITLITTIPTGKSPLTASQLIWVNVLMCLLGGIMMVMELSSVEELAEKPFDDRDQPIVTKKLWENIAIQVMYQASACMVLEFGEHVSKESEKHVRKTMIFNTFLLCQLFNLLNTMELLKKEIVVQSYYFSVALGGCFVMQVVVIEYAKGLGDCMRLNAVEWGICVLVGALSCVFERTLKKILHLFSGEVESPLPP